MMVIVTITMEKTFGSMCDAKTRKSDAPKAFAAST